MTDDRYFEKLLEMFEKHIEAPSREEEEEIEQKVIDYIKLHPIWPEEWRGKKLIVYNDDGSILMAGRVNS